MIKKLKKNQRLLLTCLIVVCMGSILAGGMYYLSKLRDKLQKNAIQSVMNVTAQHKQAFDNFISGDQERLHTISAYLASNNDNSRESIQRQIHMFEETDAIYSVICLDEGWFCSSASEEPRQIDEENLAYYRSLTGSGVRDSFIGIFSGRPKFAFYETFTFSNGHKGLIQKAYDRNDVSETFSLSFYSGQGLSYILDSEGDILLRSFHQGDSHTYENVFDALTDTHSPQESIDAFRASLDARETGSIIFTGDNGDYVYTYDPVERVDGWYMLSIVAMDAITEEANQMVNDTRLALGFLVLLLALSAVFFMLILRTHKEIKDKDEAIDYQSQLFKCFGAYLAGNTDDVFLMLDQETDEIEYVSPNIKRVLGMDVDSLINALRTLDMTEDPEKVQEYFRQLHALTPGKSMPLRSIEVTNPKTGELKYFLENIYCTDIQGRSKRMVYISDRTKERKDHNNLAEALHMARAANDAKSAFLSSVSHDIRTPMNAIIGFLALMRDEVDNPAMVMEYNKRIDAASQHLLGLINDVLDMNKIESGSTTLSISEMDLAEVIEEINTIIRPQTRAKDQIFDIFVSHLTYEHLLGDKLRINQILINLLSNAVKYTPENGKIQMRVDELEQVVNNYSRIRFTISDNGLGMSEDYLNVIFDPFTREETKVTHEIQGTGLGMAITKSLVDLMGGTIHVQSELNKGSTFVVELELRIQEKEDDPQFWVDHSVTRMIVTDDEEEVCHNIVKAMSRTGVEIDYSTNGEAAIEMMRSARKEGRPYDLILLDWKMPGLNGLETARLIRREYSDKIPILLLTAYDWSEIEQEALEIGVNHFMPKPFFMSTFKGAIRRVMGSLKKAESSSFNVVQGKHILVVDDIEVNRIILVKILGTLDAVCDVAGNGQEAVEKFESSKPGEYDLILMDVQMPVMDGYAATRAIRDSSHPSANAVPIIAMTANAFVDDVRDAIQSGMDAHIAKPVQIDKLKATIQQVLDNRREQEKWINE